MDLILACARTRLGNAERERITALAAAETDWPGVVRRARDHGVAPLVQQALEKVCPAAPCEAARSELRASMQASRYRARALTHELLYAASRLEQRGIPVLSFKGPALAARAYGDVALRQPTDLDLLVPAGDFAAAREVLCSEGYRDAPPSDPGMRSHAADGDHALTLLGPDGFAPIDLHCALMPTSFPGHLDIAGVWRRHDWLELGGGKVRCLRAEDEVVYLCVHGSKNWWHRLAWVCDVAETIESRIESASPLDWDEVTSLARRAGVRRMLGLGMLLAADVLRARVPDEVRSMARSDRAVQSLAERAGDGLRHLARTRHDDLARVRFHLSLADGPAARAAHLLHITRRYARPNALDRAALPVRLWPILDPLYYAVRAGRLALRLGLGRTTRRTRK